MCGEQDQGWIMGDVDFVGDEGVVLEQIEQIDCEW